jgi:hypothetical protein
MPSGWLNAVQRSKRRETLRIAPRPRERRDAEAQRFLE